MWDEEKDGKPKTSGDAVKKWKYQKYVDSSSIDANYQEGLQCVLCPKIWLQSACFHVN